MTEFLSILAQIRIFHWQTKSYAEHKALGELYESLDELVDDFIETFSGSKGKVPAAKDLFSIRAKNYSGKESTMMYMDEIVGYLSDELPKFLDEKTDTDLLNIRDDMLGAVNHTKYLLNLS